MAENEPIGGISVSITGDYSQLQEDLQRAEQIAKEAGQAIGSAIETGAASADVSGLTAALDGVGTAATEAGAGIKDFDSMVSDAVASGKTLAEAIQLTNDALNQVAGAASSAAEGVGAAGAAAGEAGAGLETFSESAQALIDKQAELEESVNRATFTLQELYEAYDNGAVSAEVLARAEEELAKAVERASVSIGEYGSEISTFSEAAQAVVDRQAALDEAVNQSTFALQELSAAYEQGTVSAEVLARAQLELDNAIEKASGSLEEYAVKAESAFSDSAQAIIDKQNAMEAAVSQAAATLQELYRAYEQGSVSAEVLARAQQELATAVERASVSAEHSKKEAESLGETWVSIAEKLGIAIGLFEIGKEALAAFGGEERNVIALSALTGQSIEEAGQAMDKLKEKALAWAVAEDALQTVQLRLSNFDLSAAQISAGMEAAANAAAATARSFEDTSSAIERMVSQGTAGARQLRSLGLTIEDLAKALNTTKEQAAATFKALDEGGRMDALTRAMEKYQGQAEKTAAGILGQFKAVGLQAEFVAEDIGRAIEPILKAVATMGGETVQTLRKFIIAFEELPAPIKDTALAVGILIAAVKAADAASVGVGFLANALKGLGIAGAAFGGMKLGEWLQTFSSDYKAAEAQINALNAKVAEHGVIVQRGGDDLQKFGERVFEAWDKIREGAEGAAHGVNSVGKAIAEAASEANVFASGLAPLIDAIKQAISSLDSYNPVAMATKVQAAMEVYKTVAGSAQASAVMVKEALLQVQEAQIQLAEKTGKGINESFVGQVALAKLHLGEITEAAERYSAQISKAFSAVKVFDPVELQRAAHAYAQVFEDISKRPTSSMAQVTEAALGKWTAELEAADKLGQEFDRTWVATLAKVDTDLKDATTQASQFAKAVQSSITALDAYDPAKLERTAAAAKEAFALISADSGSSAMQQTAALIQMLEKALDTAVKTGQEVDETKVAFLAGIKRNFEEGAKAVKDFMAAVNEARDNLDAWNPDKIQARLRALTSTYQESARAWDTAIQSASRSIAQWNAEIEAADKQGKTLGQGWLANVASVEKAFDRTTTAAKRFRDEVRAALDSLDAFDPAIIAEHQDALFQAFSKILATGKATYVQLATLSTKYYELEVEKADAAGDKLSAPYLAMMAAAKISYERIRDFNKNLKADIENIIRGFDTFDPELLTQNVEAHKAAYDQIAMYAGAASMKAQAAWLSWQESVIQKSQQAGEAIDQGLIQQVVLAKEAFDTNAHAAEIWGQKVLETVHAVQNAYLKLGDDIAGAFADMITKGTDFGKAMESVFLDLANTIIKTLVKGALNDLMGALGLLDAKTKASMVSLKDLFTMFGGSGTKTVSSVATTATNTAGSVIDDASEGITSKVGTGTSTTSGLGGTAGVVNMVSGVVSAITDVLGYFQTRRMEKDIGRIEVTTREIKAILDGMSKDLHGVSNDTVTMVQLFWNPLVTYLQAICEKLDAGVLVNQAMAKASEEANGQDAATQGDLQKEKEIVDAAAAAAAATTDAANAATSAAENSNTALSAAAFAATTAASASVATTELAMTATDAVANAADTTTAAVQNATSTQQTIATDSKRTYEEIVASLKKATTPEEWFAAMREFYDLGLKIDQLPQWMRESNEYFGRLMEAKNSKPQTIIRYATGNIILSSGAADNPFVSMEGTFGGEPQKYSPGGSSKIDMTTATAVKAAVETVLGGASMVGNTSVSRLGDYQAWQLEQSQAVANALRAGQGSANQGGSRLETPLWNASSLSWYYPESPSALELWDRSGVPRPGSTYTIVMGGNYGAMETLVSQIAAEAVDKLLRQVRTLGGKL